MLVSCPKRRTIQPRLACGLITTVLGVLMAGPASAHFVLQAPAASLEQDGLGNPQKAGPCGDDGSGTATDAVTSFQAGQTITVTINETIFHPGHYRISVAPTGTDDFPAEPVVTEGNNTPCGSAAIDPHPVFPVLADGVLEHDAPFNGPQTVTITLPSDFSCEKCSLQVLEFMANHPLNDPGGCYYHHCASITVEGGGSPSSSTTTTSGSGTGGTAENGASSSSGTTSGAGGASSTGGGSDDSSSGCQFTGITPSTPAVTGLAGLGAVAAMLRRRRRR